MLDEAMVDRMDEFIHLSYPQSEEKFAMMRLMAFEFDLYSLISPSSSCEDELSFNLNSELEKFAIESSSKFSTISGREIFRFMLSLQMSAHSSENNTISHQDFLNLKNQFYDQYQRDEYGIDGGRMNEMFQDEEDKDEIESNPEYTG